MKPRIMQAKNQKRSGVGPQPRKNWLVRYGNMMLVYDTFDHALTGLVDLSSAFAISPKGLVSYQLVPAPVGSRPMFSDGYDDAHDDEFDDWDEWLSREELAQRCTDCEEQDKCCFVIHAEMDDLT